MRALPAIVVFAAFVLAGCGAPPDGGDPGDDNDGTEGNGPAPARPWPAVALSPRDYGEHFPTFFDEAGDAAHVLAWGGLIDAFLEDGGAPEVVARQWDGPVFLQTSPYRQEDGDGPGTIAEDGDRWRQALVDFVQEHEVAYLGLGVEVNFLRENAPERYEELVEWYPSVYDAVKAASPDTQVFPTFQYERITGRHGGLWGGPQEGPASWDALDDFPQRDLDAFTTYPHLVHSDPGDIPSDYYDALEERATRPVALTETGWPAEDVAEGWQSDPDEQAAAVDVLLARAPPTEFTLWLHLYDQPTGPAFASLGLRADDGSARPALGAWQAHFPALAA